MCRRGTVDAVPRHAIPRRTRGRARGCPHVRRSRPPRELTKLERRAALEAEIVREMNQIRDRTRRTAAARRTEPTHGRAGSLESHARARLLRARLRGRDGIQRSDPALLHQSGLGDVVGRRSAARQRRTADRREGDRRARGSTLPPHREVILSSAWRDAGIGAVYTSLAPREYGGSEAVVVTADFGLRREDPALVVAPAVTPPLRAAANTSHAVVLGRVPCGSRPPAS